MNAEELLALARQATRDGEIEAYTKRGRSRRLELAANGATCAIAVEEGWAVRAGDARGSWFASGSGIPPSAGSWPRRSDHSLRLPEPAEAPAWTPPPDLGSPLVGESEGLALLEGILREVEREAPGARLVAARLDDGASDADLASSRGLRCAVRHRSAALRLEMARGVHRVLLETCERDARRFRPLALARRIADRFAILADGVPREAAAATCLLAPPVAARLLESALAWLVGAGALEGPLAAAGAHAASAGVSVVDDGRLAGGLLESPVDGEGSPTGARVLVERGKFRQPLLAWWEAARGQASGCARRASFRDVPRRAPTHLFLTPDPAIGVASLVAGVERGGYWIDVDGALVRDGSRFHLPVVGFALAGGQAREPVAGVALAGDLAELWRAVVAVGRDLAFLAGDGMIGSPTLLVRGLEVVARG
ncbi:MAG: metallopeptidase TldD-related protein [Thermoanaerobaculia bacterium]